MQFKLSPTPVNYEDALAFMDARVDGIYNGTEQECVWLLEHPPLYTAGTSAKQSDLLKPQFPVYTAGRGGEYTYHGPGQRVAYVMMDLRKRQKAPDIKAYVWFLEEWIIRALAEFGVSGKRICGRVGIWVDTPQGEQKIAAIGVRVRRWVTLHGIAINVNPDLSHFGGIVSCGISDAGVTSIAALGASAEMAALDEALQRLLPAIPLKVQEQQCQ
ncbi:MAG TPA: lipoyl(octanoyl) transferase LipB [Alphaproteobacteria bacterium]|nr:lipoyl(octanoyl) transferase LipB [Alphaproteobacteria bacterium]